MKLIIQIPAWNEEEHLPEAIAALPREVDGFDAVEVLVIDDGSDDGTAEVARAVGAEVVRLPVHRGLAVAFSTGIRHGLERGADVIVNTDADNQYDARDIPTLVRPILDGKAQMVIGDRQVAGLRHFSPTKRLLQKLGSWVVTYTLETILQAGEAGLKVVSVPVRVNSGAARPSRLFSSTSSYVLRSLASMARIVILYNPLRIFLILGSIPVGLGAALLVRFLWFYLTGNSPAGHIQSLILAVILVVIGALIWLAGILSDLIAVNRRLLEEVVERQRRQSLEGRR